MFQSQYMVWVVGVALLSNSIALGEDRLEVPGKERQDAARKTISEIYREEYEIAKKPVQRVALAKKLIQVGVDTHDDDASQYLLWHIARKMKESDAATDAPGQLSNCSTRRAARHE